MSEMVSLTINDRKVKGNEGDTILDVCRDNGIYVPTLCHLEGLTDVGSCRLCVVEIEGERRISPACTYPVREGLVVRTHTDRLEKYRRMVLELLFAERNHLCAICAATGECELQSLAYRYQMDHVRYPYSWPHLPVDSVNQYIVIDHNRCVLCGRCVRVCAEVVGNHTLDFSRRGWRTLLCADLNQPLGESSCISCGACVQACPTGAIFAKTDAYRGNVDNCRLVTSVCTQCGLGCEINVYTRGSGIVRIDSPSLTRQGGQLCYRGRFEQLYEKYARVYAPTVKNRSGGIRRVGWTEVLNRITRGLGSVLKRYGPESVVGIASARANNESLRAFSGLMREVIGTYRLDSLDGAAFRTVVRGITAAGASLALSVESPIEDILKADCILIVGAEPLKSHPVAGSYILQATNRNRAHLITLDSRPDPFPYRTPTQLRAKPGAIERGLKALISSIINQGLGKANTLPEDVISYYASINIEDACQLSGIDLNELNKAGRIFATAGHAVIVYGDAVMASGSPSMVADILNLARLTGNMSDGKANLVGLKPSGNSRGAWEIGIANTEYGAFEGDEDVKVKAAYVFACDEYVEDNRLIDQLRKVNFVIVQASYLSPLTEIASIVLPSPTWSERGGSYTTLDGRRVQASPVFDCPDGMKDDASIINDIAMRLIRIKKRG
ncbi:MAG: molybdopterin-dependent oxidoreductase [Dehalococcoidia bacterium]|nr:molybdopterin-dependent oxidoreductase [Dehalococcoidia bacterium]